MNKNQVLKYLKETELDVQSAKASFYAIDLVFGFYANSDNFHKINFSPVLSYFLKSQEPFSSIINKNFIAKLSRKIYDDFSRDKKSLNNKIKEHQALTKKLDIIWEEYEQAQGELRSKREYPGVKKFGLNKKILKKFYKKFENISKFWWYYGVIGEDKGAIIEHEIIPSFAQRNNISISKAQEFISILSHPKERAVFNLERKEFLEICLLVLENKSKNKILENKINLYLKHYFWIKTDFYKADLVTKKTLLEDVEKEINKKSEKEIKKELILIDRNFRSIKNKKIKKLKQIKLSKEDKDDIYFCERTIYWIDQRKLGMMKSFYYIFNILNDIARFYNISYSDIALYGVNDLNRLLETDMKSNRRILKRKNNNIITVHEKGKSPRFFYGKIADEMFKIASYVKEKELKGIVASKGKAKIIKGRVRVVLNPAKTEFKEGEILVTSMTRIEFVPLMRKAKAIITNEGGLACHAAIVSRELGIPAIIGTKNATEVLKDGDLVELDLKIGVIIKK